MPTSVYGMYEGNPIGIPYNIVNGPQTKKPSHLIMQMKAIARAIPEYRTTRSSKGGQTIIC